MKRRTIAILVTTVAAAAAIVVAGYLLHWFPQVSRGTAASAVAIADNSFGWKFPTKIKFPSTGSVGGPIAYSDIRDPGGMPQGLPVRLQIPEIGVDSTIEDALITSDGRMDVPAGSVDVAWFALGPHPGQTGSAVIGGHYGIRNGVPFVFYDLDKLKIGDKVYILDDGDSTLAFVVRSIKSFDRNADATPVFVSTDGLAHLNLITCEGVWNQVNGNYPQRLVIFTDEIPSEGAAPAAVSPRAVAVAPQAALGQKGSLGLPSMGEVATSGPAYDEPISPVSPPALIQLMEDAYATPLDGAITSLLLIGIGCMTFTMIKRKR